MAAQGSSTKMKELRLPMSRVKTIMKSSPYVDTVAQDALYLVTKATELLIHYVTEEAHSQSNKGHNLDYKHLAEVVQTNDTLEFLREIIPRKITVRQFKEMMAARSNSNSSESSSESSSSESSSDSDSDSESDTDTCSNSDNNEKNEVSLSSEQETEAQENGKCSFSDKSEVGFKSDSKEESNK